MASLNARLPANPFALAITSFISDVKWNEDTKSPFYTEVLAQINSGLHEQDLASESNLCAARLAAFVEDLERKQRRDSKTRWIAEKLRPLISGLDQYAKICDLAIQAAPSAAILLYGGARLVLQLAQGFNSCFDTILSIMEDIGHLLQCYHLFSSAYQASAEMRNRLVESYKNIVIFWQKASKLLSRRAYKTLLVGLVKPLSSEWQICRQRLLDDSERVKMLAQATEADLRRQKDLEQMIGRQNKTRREIVDWIKACEDDESLDIRGKIRANLEIRHHNTCEWLFEHPSTTSWLKARKAAAIWHNAPPGTGKTVTASAFARKLQDMGLKTAIFFCSFNDMTLRKPITAFRCLALQLLTLSNTIPDQVLRLFEEDVKHHCFELKDMNVASEVVEALLQQQSRVHIIIDGLDECEERSELYKHLSRLMRAKTYGIVKWFMTSRPDRETQVFMGKNEVMELVAPQDSLIADIRQYVAHTVRARVDWDCEDCIEQWTSESEGNFLWVTVMLRIIDGEDSSYEEEIDEQMKKFPKGLTGAYVRTLEQLSKRPESHQQLARRIFATIVSAAQPLHLSELSQALAMAPGLSELSARRVPRQELIETLCSNLFIFDRKSKGSESDPLIKIAHKSIQDFFLQDPESLDIPRNLRQYFVSKSSSLDLANSCLWYLSLSRYQQSLDVENILNDKEHAFLRHAATFWHQYFNQLEHSRELFREIETFVRSKAFWTCIAVQARTAPFLFACYIQDAACNHFRMECIAPRPDEVEEEADINYALPLPQWLEKYGPSGTQLVQALHAFVRAWHPVITSHPSALNQCVMDERWETMMYGASRNVSGRMSLFCLCDDESWFSAFWNLSVSDVRVNSNIVEVSLFGTQPPASGSLSRITRLRFHLEPTSPHTNSRAIESVSADIPADTSLQSAVSSTSYAWNEPFWLIDARFLHAQQLIKSEKGILRVLNVTPDIVPAKAVSPKWKLVDKSPLQMNDTEGIHEQQAVAAFHFMQEQYDGDIDSLSTHDSALGSSSSRTSSLLDLSSDSGIGSDESSLRESATRNCMLFLPGSGPPKRYYWTSAASPRVEVFSAVHPNKNIAVWSPSAHEIYIMHLPTGQVQSTILPEPADVQLTSVIAIRKELRFSPTGNLLYYLLYAVEETEGEIRSKLSVSTFICSIENDQDVSLQQVHSTQTLAHECDGALRYPLLLTSWTFEHLYIALPQLYCKPTILRLQLYSPTEKDHNNNSSASPATKTAFETLRNPIYFPSFTPFRNPQMKILNLQNSNKQILTLALDAETSHPQTTSSSSPRPTDQEHADQESNTIAATPIMRDPPILMTWTIDRANDWRAWEPEISGRSNELKDKKKMEKKSTYEMLRGSFVDADQRFNVPVRSGLDWTRKAFLSCA